MIPPINNSLRPGLFDLVHHRGIIDGAGGDPLEEDHLGLLGGIDEGPGKFRQAFPVISLVVEHGDLFHLQDIHGKLGIQAGLGVIGGDGAEEIRVLAALGQIGIGGGGRHGDDARIFINAQGRFRSPAADMSQHHMDAAGHKLGGGVRRHFRFADVVLSQNLDFLPQDAALGIELFDHQFGGPFSGQSVRSKIAAVGPGDTQPDGVRRRGGTGKQERQANANKPGHKDTRR